MMFRGTYTSDFYRAVRNLLHDQVALESPGSPLRGAEYHRTKAGLDRRWQKLLSHEQRYRIREGAAEETAV
ncbi:MAG TPA: Mg-protoporphyrin IX monomethyl ester oxidative cyclase, partial [Gammaproteobacteria bacterium]|nr:Mg-protoporphyrin IX monomethyl ester oxidative cyclase [Gammaproteobacteria bacterium]